MNILMLSKDPTLLSEDRHTFGDTLTRHQLYAATLRARDPQGEIRVLTHSLASQAIKESQPCPGLHIYGTASRWRIGYLPDALRKLPAVLANGWRPDIVSTQTPWEEGSLGWLLARRLGAKFIPQLHFDLFSPDWRREHWLNPWRRTVASFTLRHADCIRAVSQMQRQKLVEHLRIDPARISVVPVGVNFRAVAGEPDHFKAQIHPALVGRPVILFVGRFYAPKNLPLWVDVAARIHAVMPEVAFVMAGDGPLMPQIRAQVEQAGLAEGFHLLGSVSHVDLPAIYAAADVFLLTSHYEGFGRVIVEAGLAGVPAVATRCTGPEDIIEEGVSGFLHPPGDAEGLTASTLRLLRDTDLKNAMSRAIRARVEERFGQQALADQLVAMWFQA